MEVVMRFIAFILRIIGIILHPFFVLREGFVHIKLPSITDKLLMISASDLAVKIRTQEVTSEEITRAYIERIKAVNPIINAVVEDRFAIALEEAKTADENLKNFKTDELEKKYPLYGIPFTVKESCGVKGLSQCVASVPRIGCKSYKNGLAVSNLKLAGAIPLLVSANPEFCCSWETNSLVKGRCCNPYDPRRTSGGSSGGEGALNAAGASVFGVASDIAGSIRVPSLFNGVFGHKPTGGTIIPIGHFPTSNDNNFLEYLQIGPITRFAKDLPLLVKIMAGENAGKLNLDEPIELKTVKIHFLTDAGPTLICSSVSKDIQRAITNAVNHFKEIGATTKKAQLYNLHDTLEMSLSTFFSMDDIPDMLSNPDNPKERANLYLEILKHIYGKPTYSFFALFFLTLHETGGFISLDHRKRLIEEGKGFKEQLLNLLGTDGVLFYPSYHTSAVYHGQTLFNMPGVMYTMIFNLLGLPCTHVPMGLGADQLPVGFQIIAAPFQDRLCIGIAQELEKAFGGWVPPS